MKTPEEFKIKGKVLGYALLLVAALFLILLLASSCSSTQKLENTSPIQKGNLESSKLGEFDVINFPGYSGDFLFNLEDEGFFGINKENTKMVDVKGRRDDYMEMDSSFLFAGEPTGEKILISSRIETSRKFDREEGIKTLSETDYKSRLKDFTGKPVKIEGRTFIPFSDGKRLFLFEEGKFETLYDNGTRKMYVRSREGEYGVWVFNPKIYSLIQPTTDKSSKKSSAAYKSSSASKSPSNSSAANKSLGKSSSSSSGECCHTVQPGESMWSISQKYGVNFYWLLRINGMTNMSRLEIGQKIKLRE